MVVTSGSTPETFRNNVFHRVIGCTSKIVGIEPLRDPCMHRKDERQFMAAFLLLSSPHFYHILNGFELLQIASTVRRIVIPCGIHFGKPREGLN